MLGDQIRTLTLGTYSEPEQRLVSSDSPCSTVSSQNLLLQGIKKAKELHQSLDLLSKQLERCQILSGPKTVGYHIEEYKQLHQYSTCLPQFHMICVELQELHNMHFPQYHLTFHLQKFQIVKTPTPHRIPPTKKKKKKVELLYPVKLTWLYIVRESKINGFQCGIILLGGKEKVLK
jgi:hypothetical protein